MNIFRIERHDGSSRAFGPKDSDDGSKPSFFSRLTEFDEKFCEKHLLHLAISGTTLFILLVVILFMWALSAHGILN